MKTLTGFFLLSFALAAYGADGSISSGAAPMRGTMPTGPAPSTSSMPTGPAPTQGTMPTGPAPTRGTMPLDLEREETQDAALTAELCRIGVGDPVLCRLRGYQ